MQSFARKMDVASHFSPLQKSALKTELHCNLNILKIFSESTGHKVGHHPFFKLQRLSDMADAPVGLLQEGWLLKRSKVLHVWRRRWASLWDEPRTGLVFRWKASGFFHDFFGLVAFQTPENIKLKTQNL